MFRDELDRVTKEATPDRTRSYDGRAEYGVKTTKVRLLRSVKVDRTTIPAGSICEVDRTYKADGKYRPTVDIRYHTQYGEKYFWVFESEVEQVN